MKRRNIEGGPSAAGGASRRKMVKLVHELQERRAALEAHYQRLKRAGQLVEGPGAEHFDLFDFARVGCFTFDRKGSIAGVNLSGAALLSQEPASLRGASFSRFVTPGSRDTFSHHVGEAFASNRDQECELELSPGSGDSFYAYLRSGVIKDGASGKGFLRTTLIDTTDRTRLEGAVTSLAAILETEGAAHSRREKTLRENEAKYRGFFENAIEGMFRTTPEGHIVDANPAMAGIYGFESPRELKKTVTDVRRHYMRPEDRDTCLNTLNSAGTLKGFETRFTTKQGDPIWCSFNAWTLKTGEGVSYEGTVIDVTARKLAEERLRETTEQLRKSLVGTIRAISLILEARDPYTAGHQRRVSALARSIAAEMGLSEGDVDNIHLAGVIHDVGKIAVPADILSKASELKDIEMNLVRAHPQAGYEIMKDAELPYPIAEIVLQHHERLNGSGYPQGLKREEILLESQILAVADVVEAVASHRPYRPGRGIDKALTELDKNKGTLYNAEAVDACLGLFREKGFTFE